MSMQKLHTYLHERYNAQCVELGTYSKSLGIDPQLFISDRSQFDSKLCRCLENWNNIYSRYFIQLM